MVHHFCKMLSKKPKKIDNRQTDRYRYRCRYKYIDTGQADEMLTAGGSGVSI